MAEIKLFLLSSIDNDLNINQFFPSDYNDQNTINELLNVSKYFKKCGDGCLQTKDFKYYYKTFIPYQKMSKIYFYYFTAQIHIVKKILIDYVKIYSKY